LIGFGVFWGLAYGLVMNIYFWPFMMGTTASISWEVGLSLKQAGLRYLTFYVTTSLIWDIARAAGNGLFIAVLGIPTIAALTRFRDRFNFRVQAL
jgi:energy-coupling factor transport system substrate-specific component